jgi:hypothetical protein
LTGQAIRVALLLASSLSACTPTCKETCRKLLDCDLDSERVAFAACVDSCTDLDALYASWEDERIIEAHDAHRRCIGSSTCDEIEDGACYDEDLFVF